MITSKVRVKILSLFLSQDNTGLHVREITRRVGTEINAIRRELDNLFKAGLIRRETQGNRVYYRIKKEYPYYWDLLSCWEKEQGLASKILNEQKSLGKVKFALVSKEFITGRKSGAEDVDLLLVGTIDVKVLKAIIEKQQEKLGREINYCVMGEDEFDFRKKRLDPFIVKVLTQARIIFIGEEDKYCKI
ncbi:winged helix-turn-helix domain-containing protein [Candidatus Parcubacteria bacterium]|nr:winged helix-turn-helix domain-containing protein [Patescibacteria group bacterium]MCG2689624.1 winged helix-turn-helix domain-containing protein [Candidatus Parcubacteria bacterium]